jgi:hypothetical protein
MPKEYALLIAGWANTKGIEGVLVRNAMYAVYISLSKTFCNTELYHLLQ